MGGYNVFTGQPGEPSNTFRSDVDDDGVQVIGVPDTGILVLTETGGYGHIMVFFDSVAGTLTLFNAVGGAYTLSTGVLVGTTGLDTQTTLSVDGGLLYVENRSGTAKTYVLSILNKSVK